MQPNPPPATPAPKSTPPAGVHLLLHGREDDPSAPPSPAPRWIVRLLVGADLVLVGAGALLFFTNHDWSRPAAGALLVGVGGALAIAACLLGNRPRFPEFSLRSGLAKPMAGKNTGPTPPPRVRVHFVDEIPKKRRN